MQALIVGQPHYCTARRIHDKLTLSLQAIIKHATTTCVSNKRVPATLRALQLVLVPSKNASIFHCMLWLVRHGSMMRAPKAAVRSPVDYWPA